MPPATQALSDDDFMDVAGGVAPDGGPGGALFGFGKSPFQAERRAWAIWGPFRRRVNRGVRLGRRR